MANKLLNIPTQQIDDSDRARQEYPELEELAESIKAKGLIQPITVRKTKNGFKLLAGGRRFRACKLADLDTIPAIVRDSSGDIDDLEVELHENLNRYDLTWVEEASLVAKIDSFYRNKFGDKWKDSKTAELLNRSVGGVNTLLQLNRAVKIIPELKSVKTKDEAFKKYKKLEEHAVVKHLRGKQKAELEESNSEETENGDQISRDDSKQEDARLSLLKHAESHFRIGDALDGLREMAKLYENQPSPIKLFEVDPPYGIDLHEQKQGKDKKKRDNMEEYHEVNVEDYKEFLYNLTDLLYKSAAEHCWVIFWYGPTWHSDVKSALECAGFIVDDIPGIWYKRTGQTNRPDVYLARAYESFFIARKGSPILRKEGRANVFEFTPVGSKIKYHPTQRPIPLMEELIETFIYPKQVACSPFLGSGAFLKAAYLQNIMAFGWDLSEKHKDYFMTSLEIDVVNKMKESEDGNS